MFVNTLKENVEISPIIKLQSILLKNIIFALEKSNLEKRFDHCFTTSSTWIKI